jgi:hypothetical protein
MDNNFLQNLVVGKSKWFSDLVDSNMLSNAMLVKPYEVSRIVSWVFSQYDPQYSTSLDAITGGIGNVMEIDQSWYEWNVEIENDRATTIRKAKANGVEITSANADTVLAGINLQPITLWLEDKSKRWTA